MADKRKVFVSYSSKNRELVKELVDDLEKIGHDVWYDQRIKPGQDWWQEILEGIRNCELFLIAVTPDSLESEACDQERKYARALNRVVLPIVLTDGIRFDELPDGLSSLQIINYRVGEKSSTWRLIGAVNDAPPADLLPDPLPIPPDPPISDLTLALNLVTSTEHLDGATQNKLLFQLTKLQDAKPNEVASLFAKLRKREDTLTIVSDEIDRLLGRNQPEIKVQSTLDDLLHDRHSYTKFSDFVKSGEHLSIYGASAIIVHHEWPVIEEFILKKPNGKLRVMLQDPSNIPAVEILQRQLDVRGREDLPSDINRVLKTVAEMMRTGFNVECRLQPFSPGFSLSIVDPHQQTGILIVEFLGYRNISRYERMHIKISKERSPKWFKYWVDQYEAMWEAATPAFT